MEQKTSFTQAHLENKLWANELSFYQEEINIFQLHLQELTKRNTSLQQSERADFFRGQLARYRDLVSQLLNEISTAEQKMAIYARGNGNQDLDAVNVGDHYLFRDKILSFKEDYARNREAFKAFEATI
jgi:hypothetical protein